MEAAQQQQQQEQQQQQQQLLPQPHDDVKYWLLGPNFKVWEREREKKN
jgi:hypothetical protein